MIQSHLAHQTLPHGAFNVEWMTQGQSENSRAYIITAIIGYLSLSETNSPAILSLLEASSIILIRD